MAVYVKTRKLILAIRQFPLPRQHLKRIVGAFYCKRGKAQETREETGVSGGVSTLGHG